MDKKFCDDCKQEIPRKAKYVIVRIEYMYSEPKKFSFREYCMACAKLHLPDPSR
jgi:hypothetical protein